MPEFPSTVVVDGLVSYWTFDDKDLVGSVPGATVKDIKGSNDGTTSGTISTGAVGKINEAFDFDGVDDYIALDMRYETAIPAVTIGCWAKLRTTGCYGLGPDFDRSEYYHIQCGKDYIGDDPAFCGNGLADLRANVDIVDGKWHHVVGKFVSRPASEGDDQFIYVDGKLRNSTNSLNGGTLGTGATRWGFIGDGSEASSYDGSRNSFFVDGTLDEVFIYHRALSDFEIRRLYRETRSNKLGRGFPGWP